MANFQELKDAVRSQAGVAVDDATAGLWVNERYKSMVVRAQWLMKEASLGTTVAGQGRYPLDDAFADVEELLVGEATYVRASARQMYRLKNGRLKLSFWGVDGAFSPAYGANGEKEIALFEVPEVAGAAITALVAATPADLAGTATPVVPVEFHEYIRDGAVGTGLALIDERLDEAQWFLDRYEQAVQLLGRRRNSRVGSGPFSAQLAGQHF